jgi:two-component system, OmpR family, response regulator
MEKVRIMLAEDDENLGTLLREYLRAKTYEVDLYTDGEKAFNNFTKNHYDICILDIMMPIKDGFTVAKEIRMINNDIPIIFLTAKALKEDVYEGFKLGADDYITKPFNMEELLFRIEAILRRTKSEYNPALTSFKIGHFTFESNKQTLELGDVCHKLTTKESELMKLLCIHRNTILERNYALKAIWADDSYFTARSMDVYITKLRKYLKDDPSIEIINVHGKGFKLVISGEEP